MLYSPASARKIFVETKERLTVMDQNYLYICESYNNSMQKLSENNCDSRYVLRNLLSRGVEEANYLSFQFDGNEAEKCIKIRNKLDDVVINLSSMLDDDGNVLIQYQSNIGEVVWIACLLLAFERDQTNRQFDMVEERLEGCSGRECQSELNAA